MANYEQGKAEGEAERAKLEQDLKQQHIIQGQRDTEHNDYCNKLCTEADFKYEQLRTKADFKCEQLRTEADFKCEQLRHEICVLQIALGVMTALAACFVGACLTGVALFWKAT